MASNSAFQSLGLKKTVASLVEEIQDLLRTGGKPTLVEVYSDYGLD